MHALADAAEDATSDRVIAYGLDFVGLSAVSFALYLLTAVVSFVLQTLVGATVTAGTDGFDPGGIILSLLLSFVLYGLLWVVIAGLLVAYFGYLPRGDGQTVGKSLMDVRVVDDDGGAATNGQHLKRAAVLLAPVPLVALLSILLGIIGFFLSLFVIVGWHLLELVVMFADDRRRRLGDRFAGTTVVPTDTDAVAA